MPDTLDYQTPQKKKRLNWILILSLGTLAFFLGLMVVLPALNRARYANSNRTPATDHLHQIGLAILLYSNENGGQMPPTLATLLVSERLLPEVLIDPASNQTPATGSTPQAIEADVAKGGHQTFIYLGGGMNRPDVTDATTLIAYEPLSVYGTGTNALFGDGHCEWLDSAALAKALSPRSTTTSQPTTAP